MRKASFEPPSSSCADLREEQRRDNLFQRMPVGLKLMCLFAALIVNLIIENPVAGLLGFAAAAATLVGIGVNPRRIASRLLLPLGMVAFAFATQLVWYGREPIAKIAFMGISFALYKEGLMRGLAIAARAMAGYSFILLFIETTPYLEVLTFARKRRLPPVLIDIASMTVRFVFVLGERARTIKEAQTLRFGYAGFSKGLKSAGILGGKLAIDSFDRAARVYDAMKLRGYRS